jgi:hypothetical protein
MFNTKRDRQIQKELNLIARELNNPVPFSHGKDTDYTGPSDYHQFLLAERSRLTEELCVLHGL